MDRKQKKKKQEKIIKELFSPQQVFNSVII